MSVAKQLIQTKTISNQADRLKILRGFFRPMPSWAVITAILGIVLLLIGFAGKINIALILIGLIGAGLGGYFIFDWIKYGQFGAQIGQWLDEANAELVERAMEKLDLDAKKQRIPAIIISPPLIPGSIMRTGTDKIPRFSAFDFNVLLCEAKELGIYECNFWFSLGGLSDEITNQYFYKDIVSIAIAHENNGNILEITSSGGNKMRFAIVQQDLQSAEQGVNAIRKIIREHKS